MIALRKSQLNYMI